MTGYRKIDINFLETLLTPAINAMGINPVLMRLIGGQQRPTIQILVERLDGSPVTLDECAKVNRQCGALIDVEDCIDAAYVLEVSSPGIDRPLVKPQDFVRFLGYEASIELQQKLDGRRRFKGKLVALEGNNLSLQEEGATVVLPFADISHAKLVLNDMLLKSKAKPKAADAEVAS